MIRKSIITLACMLLMSVHAFAIPADPQPKKVKLPDGTYITVYMRGDEYGHAIFNEQGEQIVWDKAKQNFVLATSVTGNSGLSGNAGNAGVSGMKKAPRKVRIHDSFPLTGSPKDLVVLITFSDMDFTSIPDAKAFYTGLLNTEGFTWEGTGINGSARDFYRNSSMGLFTPEFTVMGPVKLSNESAYYGGDSPSQDANCREGLVEALKALDDEIDYSEYDHDGDGVVDNVYFFYPGNGQADTPNGDDYIWPHSWNLDEYNLELDGVRFSSYAISNEIKYSSTGEKKPTGIGTFVHEFGHVLGLADHYDSSSSYLAPFTPGSWDTMASGAYNNNMNTPPAFSAFERAELGWMDYTILDENADSIIVMENLADCNVGYRVNVKDTPNEYYILENRQQKGWDKYIPNHGMLIWHVDMDSVAWVGNYVNTTYGHQRLDIVEVDGSQSESDRAGDCMPGSAGVTQYTFNAWDGTEVFAVDDCRETALPDETFNVRTLLAGTAFQLPAPESITASNIKAKSFSFKWDAVDDAKIYKVSVYSMDGDTKKYVGNYKEKEVNTSDVLEATDLTPNTEYTVEVTAGVGHYLSATTSTTVTTSVLPFTERQAANLTATDVTENGFTANWDAVDDATDYEVTLSKNGYAVSTETKGYDFTEKYDGMPDLWSSSSDTYYSVSGFYGQSAPSLRLSSNNDYLIVAYPESIINEISFWSKAKKSGEKLHIETRTAKDNNWTDQQTVNVSTTGETSKIDLSGISGVTAVRLRYEHTSQFIVLDDVYADVYSTEQTPVEGYNNVLTGGKASIVFSGLEKSTTYTYSVQALNASGERSLKSEARQKTNGPSIVLGYCNGEMAESTTTQMNGKDWVSGAIKLSAAQLNAYPDAEVTAIRAALVARINIDTLRVWVRTDLDGENLAQGTITKNTDQTIQKGWNEIKLDTPFSLSSLSLGEGQGEALYIGFSFHQKMNVAAVGFVGDGQVNTCFLQQGENAAWEDVCDKGNLSIEAVITGDEIPERALAITNATVSPNPSAGATALKVIADVQNLGAEDIDDFAIECAVNGKTVSKQFSQMIKSTQSTHLIFTVDPGVEVGSDDEIEVTPSVTNGQNYGVKATYCYLKNVLCEEFTTEKCPNCPRVAEYLTEVHQGDYEDRVAIVCHHNGYYTDEFSQPCDEDLLALYNNGSSTYAPAIMVDRQPWFTYSNKQTCTVCPNSITEIAGYWDKALALTANAVIGATLEFNSDSTMLTVNTTCKKNDNYHAADPRVTVYLTEDNLKCTAQSGATGTYYQQHVIRAYNSSWGEPIEWDANGTASYSYSMQVASSWKKEDLKVVVVLSNYDEDDVLNRAVENSACIDFLGSTDGIEEITSNLLPLTNDLYNIAGQRVSQNGNYKGVIIRNGKKYLK